MALSGQRVLLLSRLGLPGDTADGLAEPASLAGAAE